MSRAGAFAALLVALLAAAGPVLAHGTGGEGSNGGDAMVPLLLGGGALVAGGLMVRARGMGAPWVVWAMVAGGVGVAAAGLLASGGGDDRPDVHLSIVEPGAGSTIPADEPVVIRVVLDGPIAAGPEDQDGGHLHLSVDGQLQQMPYSTQTEVTLEPGRHTLTVEYVDNRHIGYDPPIEQTLEVTAT